MDISQLLNPVDCESDVELRGARDHDASNSPSPPQNVPRLMEKYSAHVSPWQSKERTRYDDGIWERRFINSRSEMDDSQATRQSIPLRRTPISASRDLSVAFMCGKFRSDFLITNQHANSVNPLRSDITLSEMKTLFPRY